jgi:peptidyl-prolyl cis-trans isomerase B (cyclophilin B)
VRKYFFFDIDGTLTTPLNAVVPDSTREAIYRLQKKGHFVSLATGRLQCDAIRLAHTLDIHDVVSDGGNGITVDDRILYHEGLDMDACARLVQDIDEKTFPWAAATENRMVRYAIDTGYLDAVSDRYYETIVDPSFDIRDVDHVFKMYIACHPENLDRIPLHNLPHVWFKPDVLLLEPTHKEKGILRLMDMWNISPDQIVVFGDGMNDCSMFRPEWMSIAMGNAKPALKEKAKYITDRADENGVYNALRKFGWI